MSNAVYPNAIRGLDFTTVKAPEFDTLLQSAANRYETRLEQMVNPIWHWSLKYGYLRDDSIQAGFTYTDLRTLMGFYLSRSGRYDSFLYNDIYDNSVGPAMIGGSPNPLAELSVVTDGTTYYSPVQRNMGGFYEDVTDLNGSITVYANGVLQTGGGSNYTLKGPGLAINGFAYMGLYLQWVGSPATPVTAQFNFYFRVRFEMDTQDFEQFLSDVWTIGGDNGARGSGEIKLVSARPPTT